MLKVNSGVFSDVSQVLTDQYGTSCICHVLLRTDEDTRVFYLLALNLQGESKYGAIAANLIKRRET